MGNSNIYIKWEYIEQLYRKLMATAQQSHGLSLLPKLKKEHVCLTSYSRMRVDLATQVYMQSILLVHELCYKNCSPMRGWIKSDGTAAIDTRVLLSLNSCC